MKAQSRLQHLAKAGAGWVRCALGLAGQRVGAGLAVACETEAVKNGGTRPDGGTNGGTNRHFLAFLIGEIESRRSDQKIKGLHLLGASPFVLKLRAVSVHCAAATLIAFLGCMQSTVCDRGECELRYGHQNRIN